MLFIAFNLEQMGAKDAEQIAQNILDSKNARPYLDATQIEQLNAVARPAVHGIDESEIKRLCQELVDTLQIQNDKGVTLKFYHDTKNRTLYFGDEEGYRTAKEIHDRSRPLSV